MVDHAQHLKQIPQVLIKNQFYNKMIKCHFGKVKMHYSGHVSAKRALGWIIGRLKLLQSDINLLKLDDDGLFWGFVIT